MKRFFILSLLILCWEISEAQLFKIAGHEIGFVYLGPKVGTTFSKITNLDLSGLESNFRIGYQVGAVGEIGLTSKLSFQSEVVFTSKGIQNANSSLRMNYISIPLLAKLSFNFLGLSNVYATGGTYNNVKTNARFVFNDYGESVSEQYNVFDWGLSVGAGAAYDTKYGLLALDLRYDFGITEIDKASHSDGVRNTNQSLGVALTFKYDAVDLFMRLRKKRLNPDA